MPRPPNYRLEEMRKLHDSILKQYVCFGNTWPSLEEARTLSISTDNIARFNDLCMSLNTTNNDVYTNRLHFLAITESFFRCGLKVLQTYYKLIVVIYKKFQGAFPINNIPPDMQKYLTRLKDLMFRVANEQQLLELVRI